MLDAFLSGHPIDYLATYTRNPAVIRMIGHAAGSLYPLNDDPTLRQMAEQMEHATMVGGAAYHINRYGEDGLFQGEDPANLAFATMPTPLKSRYEGLQSVRNALIVTANVRGGAA